MIEQIIILSLITIGICCTMWEGMIFENFGDWVESKVGEFWAKPMGKCYVCATFWIGGITALFFGWPIWYAIPAMGVSAVISLLQND